MRLFALAESRILGEAVATRLGVMLDAHEERRFGDGEHKTRPLVSVRGEDVYVIQSLGGDIRIGTYRSRIARWRLPRAVAIRRWPPARCGDAT